MDMDANSAIGFCKDQKTVSQKLNILKQLGLGYLTPGEETPSLSNMPERCPKPKDLALAAKGYRYLCQKLFGVLCHRRRYRADPQNSIRPQGLSIIAVKSGRNASHDAPRPLSHPV